MKLLVILAAAWGMSLTAFAHPADISYLRVKVERQRLELRFTFNLLTLSRFVVIDGDQDRRIDKEELDRTERSLRSYLETHVHIRINDRESMLGEPSALNCVWPSPDAPPQAAEADYGQRYVDLVFTQEVKPVLEDVWLGFEIWEQTGPLGTIEATFEQDAMRTQVPFSQAEPDYLHDTGFIAEDAPLKVAPFVKTPWPTGWRLFLGLVFLFLVCGVVDWYRREW